jgi:hypothetical protein
MHIQCHSCHHFYSIVIMYHPGVWHALTCMTLVEQDHIIDTVSVSSFRTLDV